MGFHDGTDRRRDRFTADECAGIDSFPFRSTELSLLAVSDRVIDLAEHLNRDHLSHTDLVRAGAGFRCRVAESPRVGR